MTRQVPGFSGEADHQGARLEPGDVDLAADLGLGDEGVLYDPIDNYERVGGSIWDWGRDPEPTAKSTRTVDIPPATSDIPEVQGPQD